MKEKKNIFFSKGFKFLEIVLLLLSVVMFSVCGIQILGFYKIAEVSRYSLEELWEGDIPPYEESKSAGIAINSEIWQLKEHIDHGNIFTEETVDITDWEAKEKDPNTTYSVNAIQGFAESYKNNLQFLLEESDWFREQGVEYEYTIDFVGKDGYEYSEQFRYLYENGKELEYLLPESGVSLADYAKENPETVSLYDLYQDLVNTCIRWEEYQYWSTGNVSYNVMYYVENLDTGKIYTNQQSWEEGLNPEEIPSSSFCYYANRKNGKIEKVKKWNGTEAENELHESWKSYPIAGNNETIFIALDSEYPMEDDIYTERMYYRTMEQWSQVLLVGAGVSLILMVVLFILITWKTGRNGNSKEIKFCWVDKVPVEVCFAVSFTAATCLIVWMVEEYYDMCNSWNWYYLILGAALTVGLLLLALIPYLSIVRRIKGKRLWKSSLCYAIWRSCKKIYMARKTAGKMIIGFIGLVLINWLACALGVIGVVLITPIDVLVLLYLIRGNAGWQVVKDGMQRIGNGELDYKIDDKYLVGDAKQMAEVVNGIGNGLQKAVKEKLKTERLRTDLITNVSHDIKTPLTSIISYVDLLKREDIQDEKVKGYIQVLDTKSQRLKQLTEDLVESSKISSGNIVLNMQPIGLKELVQQTNGEFEEKFADHQLQLICQMTDQDTRIMADGRRMWRVLENLYNNAAKYALEGTRIYVEVEKIGCRVIFNIKNVSRNPLNIKADELTERFVRGDISRSTEGSGLGLSIAQDLVKLQNGTFDIYMDGDLFKVTMTFESTD